MNEDHPPLVGYEDFAAAGAAVQAQNVASAQSAPDTEMVFERLPSFLVDAIAQIDQNPTDAVAPDVHSAIVELERARMLPEVVAGHPVVCAPGSILHFMDEDGRLMRIVANEAGALSKAPCA